MKFTRREFLLLVILFIIAVVSLEYRFVVIPNLEKYEQLQDEIILLDSEIDAINLNLQSAERSREQRDDLLVDIETYQNRFLNSLHPSILLYRTYEFMDRNDFAPTQYTISPVSLFMPLPEQIITTDLSYELAEKVNAYRAIRDGTQGNDSEDQNDEQQVSDENGNISQIEMIQFSVTAEGEYEQIKNLMNDISGQDKTIRISNVSIGIISVDTLNISFLLEYYGIDKIDADQNVFSDWPRDAFDGGSDDPFDIFSPDIIDEIDETDDEIIEEDETTEQTEEDE